MKGTFRGKKLTHARAKVVSLDDFTEEKRAKFKKSMTTFRNKKQPWTEREKEMTKYFLLVSKTQTMEEIEDILRKNKEKLDEHLIEKLYTKIKACVNDAKK